MYKLGNDLVGILCTYMYILANFSELSRFSKKLQPNNLCRYQRCSEDFGLQMFCTFPVLLNNPIPGTFPLRIERTGPLFTHDFVLFFSYVGLMLK